MSEKEVKDGHHEELVGAGYYSETRQRHSEHILKMGEWAEWLLGSKVKAHSWMGVQAGSGMSSCCTAKCKYTRDRKTGRLENEKLS